MTREVQATSRVKETFPLACYVVVRLLAAGVCLQLSCMPDAEANKHFVH